MSHWSNFQSFEVVCRGSDTQLQMTANFPLGLAYSEIDNRILFIKILKKKIRIKTIHFYKSNYSNFQVEMKKKN